MNFSSYRYLYAIEWLLGLLLASSFYYHLNIGGTGLRIPNNIAVWGFGSLIGLHALYRFTQQKYFFLPHYFYLIIAFPALALLSGVFAGVELPEQWLFRFLYIWGGLLFLFALYQYPLKQGRLDRLLLLIVITGFLHSIVGCLQIILVGNMPHWLPLNVSGNPTGLFQQINNQASFQVTCVMICFWLFTRPIIRYGHSWLFYFLVIAVFSSIFIVSYSGSRVGVLGFLLAMPLFIVSRWQYIKNDKKRWLVITIVLSIAIASAILFERERGLTHVIDKTTALNAGFSGSSRLGMYNISIDLIKEKPYFGHGIGSFVRVWQFKKPAFYAENPDAVLPYQRVSHPHNELIFWLVEGGLIAGFGLVCVLLAILFSLWRLPLSRRYVYGAFLIPIALHTQVELPFYISALHWFVFLILLYIVLHPTRERFDAAISKTIAQGIRILALTLSFASILFLAHSLAANHEFKNYIHNKSVEVEPFQTAMENPYFERLASHMLMTQMLYKSMKYGVKNNVKIFAEWGEQELKYNPHIVFYKATTEAYIYLKDFHRACSIAQTGQAIYPTDKRLNDVVKTCSGPE